MCTSRRDEDDAHQIERETRVAIAVPTAVRRNGVGGVDGSMKAKEA
jgi:hypothetical protein